MTEAEVWHSQDPRNMDSLQKLKKVPPDPPDRTQFCQYLSPISLMRDFLPPEVYDDKRILL